MSDLKNTLCTYVDGKRDAMLQTLETVVNIDSGAYNIEGVKQVAAVYRALLEDMGFAITVLPSSKYAPHLRAYKEGRGGKRILIMCHMDTVFEDGTAAQRPFTMKDGLAYGPGVLDMKGGTVAGLYALQALHAAGWDDFGSITVLLTSDEERGSETSEAYIIEEGKRADAVLVPESGRMGNFVVIERQGGGIFNLDIYGKASHAGSAPKDGIHAIEELMHKGLALHALTDYDRGSSISVGVIRAGTRSNIIPEHAWAEIDIRCKYDADGHELMRRMQEICDHNYVEGTRSVLTKVMYRPPVEKTEGNLWLYGKTCAAAAELGVELHEQYVGGGSDGNYTSALGVPTIDSLGPLGEFLHSDKEYIIVDSLFERCKMLALALTKLNCD